MGQSHTNLCFEIAKLVELGRPFPQVLRILANSPRRKQAKCFQRALTTLQNTGDLGKALQESEQFYPFEIELCKLGNHNGRLALFWNWIANYQNKQGNHTWTLFFCVIYPLLLLHFSLLLPTLLYWGLTALLTYIEKVLLGLLLLDALLALLMLISYVGGKLGHRMPLYMVLSVPLLRRFVFKYQLLQTMSVFQALYGGGMPLINAWQTVAAMPSHPKLANLCMRVSQRLQQQQKPLLTDAIAGEKALPDSLHQFIAVGESSRQLDRILLKAKDVLEREANMALYLFVIVTSCVFTLVVAGILISKLTTWM